MQLPSGCLPVRLIPSFVLLILAAAAPALAQQQEPPTRVGTVSYVSGTIAFHMAGETQWSAAGVNYPVATGGSFWTDPQSRAELQIGPSTIDMAPGTEIDVTNLDQQVAQIGIPQGRLYLHLRQLNAGQSFEIDLPQGAVWLLQPGAYDIDAGTAGQPARVAVYQGTARFVGGGADIGVNAGDVALLSGSNPVATQFERAAPDAFVAWCRARDYHQQQLAAAYYVSPQMTGYADLDHYGGWQSNPQYGEVWYPSQVPADWAPYRDGRWIWVQPWGWTWVDQQPWGFAPFHYGRWAQVGDRWGWVPGQYAAQPVYAPALVAFIGAAAGGFAIAGESGPAVGWFPLAPDEPYWPSYTRNENYIRNLNAGNVRNIDTVVRQSNGAPPPQAANANFANRRFATVVPQRVFANAGPVAPLGAPCRPRRTREGAGGAASARGSAAATGRRCCGQRAAEPAPGAEGSGQTAGRPSRGAGRERARGAAAPAGNARGARRRAGASGRAAKCRRCSAASRRCRRPAPGPHAPAAIGAAKAPEPGRAPGSPAPGGPPHPAARGLPPPHPGAAPAGPRSAPRRGCARRVRRPRQQPIAKPPRRPAAPPARAAGRSQPNASRAAASPSTPRARRPRPSFTHRRLAPSRRVRRPRRSCTHRRRRAPSRRHAHRPRPPCARPAAHAPGPPGGGRPAPNAKGKPGENHP